jgi:hypothetical protein
MYFLSVNSVGSSVAGVRYENFSSRKANRFTLQCIPQFRDKDTA